jgi:hypothetical protein
VGRTAPPPPPPQNMSSSWLSSLLKDILVWVGRSSHCFFTLNGLHNY